MSNAVPQLKPVSADRGASNRGKVNPYASIDEPGSARDWSVAEVDALDLRLLVASVVAAGDAIMFSASKKGPLIGITVYHDGEPAKKWATNAEQFANLMDAFTRLALQQLPSQVAAKLTTE